MGIHSLRLKSKSKQANFLPTLKPKNSEALESISPQSKTFKNFFLLAEKINPFNSDRHFLPKPFFRQKNFCLVSPCLFLLQPAAAYSNLVQNTFAPKLVKILLVWAPSVQRWQLWDVLDLGTSPKEIIEFHKYSQTLFVLGPLVEFYYWKNFKVFLFNNFFK